MVLIGVYPSFAGCPLLGLVLVINPATGELELDKGHHEDDEEEQPGDG
jgi:hypothetical protein